MECSTWSWLTIHPDFCGLSLATDGLSWTLTRFCSSGLRKRALERIVGVAIDALETGDEIQRLGGSDRVKENRRFRCYDRRRA
jgi:hypothetical protein